MAMCVSLLYGPKSVAYHNGFSVWATHAWFQVMYGYLSNLYTLAEWRDLEIEVWVKVWAKVCE